MNELHIKEYREAAYSRCFEHLAADSIQGHQGVNRDAQSLFIRLPRMALHRVNKKALDTVDLVKREAFKLYDRWRDEQEKEKHALGAMKIILQCVEIDAHNTSNGSATLQLKALGEAVNTFEKNRKATATPMRKSCGSSYI